MSESSRAPLRVVIVDDEPLARDGLRASIERLRLPALEIAALCENGVVALDVIRRLQPEILLLDIAMPVLDGFAMLEQLEPEMTPPAVIFVTAYDEHALRAFDAEALAFLVKPVSDEKLRVALERAMRRVAEARALRAHLAGSVAQPTTAGYLKQLVVPERDRQLVIPVEDIEWIEGDTYYVRIHAGGRMRLLRERLANLEASLDPTVFQRTHRSAIVRIDRIREVRAPSPYSYAALLASGAVAPVSRERLKALHEALGRRDARRRD